MTDSRPAEPVDPETTTVPEPRRRWDRHRFPSVWSTLALSLSVALAAASLALDPAETDRVVALAPVDGGEVTSGPVEGSTDPALAGQADAAAPTAGGKTTQRVVGAQTPKSGGGTGSSASNTPAAVDRAGLECAPGRNGGTTDVGVTGNTIKLGATVVQSGIGASFLGDVRFAMQAVVDKANSSGGICGRKLDLKVVDDGWDFNLGGQYLRNLVEDEKVFALAVVPSSEGLKNVSDGGFVSERWKVPVVGTDGMLKGQYSDPYIWPVAASTISTMHIMVKHAYDAGFRQFALVYESNYHFGIEGAFAFNAAVKRLTKQDIAGYANPLVTPKCEKRFCGISSDAPSYNTQNSDFNQACANTSGNPPNTCDFVGLLLEPTTAKKWLKAGRVPGARMAGPQPLFTYDFGKDCEATCDGMWLWTGYLPPLGDYLSRPAVATYVEDIKAASSSADFNNSFVEGGYVGMRLVVESIKATGPNLTRENLKRTLDTMTFDSGLAPPLKWAPGNHFANTRMRAFSMQYKGGFNGWRDEQVEIEDPWVGQDTGD